MTKYKIQWIEAHDPHNWGDGDIEKGKKAILESHPYIEHHIDSDGWLDGTCEDTFNADSPEEALEKAQEYETEGVFSLLDETGKQIGTEEGLLGPITASKE